MTSTQADASIWQALVAADCVVTDKQPQSIQELKFESLVSIVLACLSKVKQAESHVPWNVPHWEPSEWHSVAARHRLGSQLASLLKELGYAGDCGYNHFLYPTEKESRKMLVWLINKLPRSVEERAGMYSSPVTLGGSWKGSDFLEPDYIQSVFQQWMSQRTMPLVPHRMLRGIRGFQALQCESGKGDMIHQGADKFTRSKGMLLHSLIDTFTTGVCLDGDLDDGILEDVVNPEETEALNREKDELFELELSYKRRYEEKQSTLEAGKAAVVAGEPEFPHSQMTTETTTESPQDVTPSVASNLSSEQIRHGEDEKQPPLLEEKRALQYRSAEDDRQRELSSLSEQLRSTQQEVHYIREKVKEEHDSVLNGRAALEDATKQAIEIQKAVKMKKKALEMLPNAKEGMIKLEALCQSTNTKIQELQQEWEVHRRSLLDEERQLVSSKDNRKARCRQYVQEMKEFRSEMKQMAKEIQIKMDEMRVLDRLYHNLPKNGSRSSYTSRIMDIIKQVHKQKCEISKIIEDIRLIQKQMNSASERLKRSEAVTDERLFSAASSAINGTSSTRSKDNETVFVDCYRKFAEVRELFEELILLIGDVGKKENTIRDLENWISQLQSRDSSAQLEKVLADLQSVKQENQALAHELKAASGRAA